MKLGPVGPETTVSSDSPWPSAMLDATAHSNWGLVGSKEYVCRSASSAGLRMKSVGIRFRIINLYVYTY